MPTAAANRRRVRNLLMKDPNYGRKSEAELETERRIRALNREMYPMPWDTAEDSEGEDHGDRETGEQ